MLHHVEKVPELIHWMLTFCRPGCGEPHGSKMSTVQLLYADKNLVFLHENASALVEILISQTSLWYLSANFSWIICCIKPKTKNIHQYQILIVVVGVSYQPVCSFNVLTNEYDPKTIFHLL